MATTSRRQTEVFRELSQQECTSRLSRNGVGRIALCTPNGPVVVPVNFVMDNGTVLLRTAPYTLIAAHAWDRAAFEIDDIDDDMRRGWSVLVMGRAAPVGDIDEVGDARAANELTPWAPGSRHMYIRITPDRITGREVAF
jgi:uncharacterized protein